MRFRGRSYMAFALAPEAPIAEWLNELDTWIRSSSGFFVGRPVVLDLSSVKLSASAIAHLVKELESRDVRIMGLEGAEAAELGPGLPPVLKGGRALSAVETADPAAARPKPTAVPAAPPAPPEPASLMIGTSVRSGQSIIFPNGDVTVLGAIASGAEVVAGGSIHVYGALRGRAMAGSSGNRQARIFCSKAEAELMAIDGYYRTAEHIDEELRNRPVQAWLEGEALMVAALD
jgi:septum site-determining protein MinC